MRKYYFILIPKFDIKNYFFKGISIENKNLCYIFSKRGIATIFVLWHFTLGIYRCYGYILIKSTFEYHLINKAINQAERTDSIRILVTNSNSLKLDEFAVGYWTLYNVEDAFRESKNLIRICSIYIIIRNWEWEGTYLFVY